RRINRYHQNAQVHDEPPAPAQANGSRRDPPRPCQREQNRDAREAGQSVQVGDRPCVPVR
ncbi:hypothetical protein LPJ62_005506, partial [Coemansia sp. RSA 2167]